MSDRADRLRIGVIGCGHWGPNHIRVFSELDRSNVAACADLSAVCLQRVQDRFPLIQTRTDYRAILEDAAIDAVVIATPTGTHAEIVRDALQAGKHVLVEKPLCTQSAEARELGGLADRVGRVLMVGHVFLFNRGIMKLREVIQRGELGAIHYLDAVRTNLGPVRGDVNALVDLGTHDISIFNYLLDATPTAVSAQGSCITQPDIEDVCFVTLQYSDGTLGQLHVSWLNPRKVRTMTVVGQRKMAHWDDVDPSNILRLYDKGLEEPPFYNSYGEFQCLLRNADVHLPRVDSVEPLIEQANAFLDSVLDGAPCRSGVSEGAAVVEILEAAQASIRNGGALSPVGGATVAQKTMSAPAAHVWPQAGPVPSIAARPPRAAKTRSDAGDLPSAGKPVSRRS